MVTVTERVKEYIVSALLILGLWTAVTTLAAAAGSKSPKAGSVGESALHLFREEFIHAMGFLVVLLVFLALMGNATIAGYFTDFVDFFLPGATSVKDMEGGFHGVLDTGANLAVAALLVYAVVIFLRLLPENEFMQRLLKDTGHAALDGTKRAAAALAREGRAATLELTGKHYETGKWRGHGGNRAGLVMSGDSRLMPSFSEQLRAGSGRDLYRENRDSLDAEIHRERMARQGHAPQYHEGGRYTAKLDHKPSYMEALVARAEAYLAPGRH